MALARKVVSTEDASLAGTIPFRKQTSPATLLPNHALRYRLVFTTYESTFFTVFTLYLPEWGAQTLQGQGKLWSVAQHRAAH